MDVDGSYLYKKKKKLEDSGQMVSFLGLPSAPLTGWETVTNPEVLVNSILDMDPANTGEI